MRHRHRTPGHRHRFRTSGYSVVTLLLSPVVRRKGCGRGAHCGILSLKLNKCMLLGGVGAPNLCRQKGDMGDEREERRLPVEDRAVGKAGSRHAHIPEWAGRPGGPLHEEVLPLTVSHAGNLPLESDTMRTTLTAPKGTNTSVIISGASRGQEGSYREGQNDPQFEQSGLRDKGRHAPL